MPLVEVISFYTADRFLEHFPKRNSILESIGKSEGCMSMVGGYGLEDKHHAYIITAWESHEYYQKMARERWYSSFIREHGQVPSSRLSIQHIEVEVHPEQTLQAPVTEIVVLKSRKTQFDWKDELNVSVAGVKEGLYFVDGAYPPLLWGEIRQAPGSYLMLVGWDNIEAHMKAVTEPLLQKHVAEILKATHIDAVHAKLRNLMREQFDTNFEQTKLYSPM